MPFIKDKFKTYHEFALAPLADIYQLEESSAPFREVNFLESAIFWNQSEDGEMTFEVEPLPVEAQFSPAFGVVVADFDNDSVQDIFLANNFFASQPETGFMDDGLSLLLRGTTEGQGDAKRNFEAVWPNKSGIVIDVASCGAAIAHFDGDGDADIAVATNNDRTRLLQNQASGPESTIVRLIGKPANRKAIGARLLASGADFQRAYSVSDGSSYLSQSDNTLRIDRKTLGRVDVIKVVWPDGTEGSIEKPWPEGVIEIRQ